MAQVERRSRLDGEVGDGLGRDLIGEAQDALGDVLAFLVELAFPQEA
ncbi:hypothetical protein [Caulobacter sp. UC70_42]